MSSTARLAALFTGAALLMPAVASADTSLQIGGSTALQPLAQAAADTYTQQNKDVKISVGGGGSGTGVRQAEAGTFDIGDSDVLAPQFPDLIDHRVCVIGFAVVANPGVGAKNVTKQQLVDIFDGKVTNWKEVGGSDVKIVVINRPKGSGTRAVFTKTIMGTNKLTEAGGEQDATGSVVTAVAGTPGAVSYAALSGVHGKGLTELSVDGTSPTDDSIESGKWPVWSYEHMFTKSGLDPDKNKEASRFIAYVTSNGAVVKKLGYILIRDMQVKETDR